MVFQFMVTNRAVFSTAMPCDMTCSLPCTMPRIMLGTEGGAGMLMMRACVRFNEALCKNRGGAAGAGFATVFENVACFDSVACVEVLVVALVEMTHHMHVRSQLTEAQRCNQQYV